MHGFRRFLLRIARRADPSIDHFAAEVDHLRRLTSSLEPTFPDVASTARIARAAVEDFSQKEAKAAEPARELPATLLAWRWAVAALAIALLTFGLSRWNKPDPHSQQAAAPSPAAGSIGSTIDEAALAWEDGLESEVEEILLLLTLYEPEESTSLNDSREEQWIREWLESEGYSI